MSVTRRQFIKSLALALVSTGAAVPATRAYSTIPFATERAGRHMRTIPSSGEQVPAIGLGSWLTFAIDLDDENALHSRVAILREFLDAGGGVLDSSPMYGVAEEVIGIALKRIGHHNKLFSATKVWTTGNRQGLMQMENSRQLWGLKSFDLMQVHNLVDWQTHLPALHTMKQQGEIRYAGVTTSHGRRHDRLEKILRTQKLDFVQFTYNILDRDAEKTLLPLAQEKGVAVIVNRPFQRGGLFDRFENHPLPAWAGDIECKSWAQFFLKFIISHPAVTAAIPATSQLAHLQENMAACYGTLPDQKMRNRMIGYITSF